MSKKTNNNNIKKNENIKSVVISVLKDQISMNNNISFVFKTYIKSILLEKVKLKIYDKYNFEFMNDNYSINIQSILLENSDNAINILNTVDDNNLNNNGIFTMSSVIEILNINTNNKNKTSINNLKELLKDKLINLKSEELFNNSDINDNLINKTSSNFNNEFNKLIINESNNKSIKNYTYIKTKQFYNIVDVLKFAFNYKINDIINLNKLPNQFFFKGLIISGCTGSGKSATISNSIKHFIDTSNIENLYCIKIESDSAKDISNSFKYAKLIEDNCLIYINNDILNSILYSEMNSITNEEDKYNEKEDTSLNDNNIQDIKLDSKLNVFLKEINNINANHNIFVICETNINIENNILNKIKKCGYLDLNVVLSIPDRNEREQIFKQFLFCTNNSLDNVLIDKIIDKIQGFYPLDIISLFKHALINAFKSNRDCLLYADFESSLDIVKPINLKDVVIDVPKTFWSDIGGNIDLINRIRQSIEWPLRNPEAFIRLGITPPNGILLYGPPGCSKTLIAKALATESGLNFLAVKGPELFSKYVGDSEKAIRNVFKKARICAPSIIFFDEIDSMAQQRGSDSNVSDKVLCQLLNELDGIESRKQVTIIAATNRPDILDKALIRSGRFDSLLYVPPPDYEARIQIFNINLNRLKICKKVKSEDLANLTEGYSGADISMICKEAGMIALSKDINIEQIKTEHFMQAINKVKPVITKEMIEFFKNFSLNNETK